MKTHAQLADRLTAAFGGPMSVAEHGRLDARLAPALERGPARRRSLRFRWTRSLLLVGALLVLAPVLFAVGAAMRDTEAPYGTGSADEYDAELAAAKAVTPIPPGATWPPYLDRADDRSASYGVGLGREMVEFNAYCLWLGDWYQAQRTGATNRVAAAAVVLDEARGWQTFSDELTSDQNLRDHTNAVIDAAQNGNAAAVLEELQLNCSGAWSGSADE